MPVSFILLSKIKRWLDPFFSKLNIVGSFPARPLHVYADYNIVERNTLLLQLDPKVTPDIRVDNSNTNFRGTGEGMPTTDMGRQQQRNKQSFAELLDYRKDLILSYSPLFRLPLHRYRMLSIGFNGI